MKNGRKNTPANFVEVLSWICKLCRVPPPESNKCYFNVALDSDDQPTSSHCLPIDDASSDRGYR